jgi:hypothetical protein
MKTSFPRTLALGAAAAILGLSSFSASALELGEQDTVKVSSGKAYKLAPLEFQQYGNSYRLDTGDTLALRQQVNRYFTQIKGQPEVELFGRSPGVFETASGTRLEFRDNADMIAITGLQQLPGATVSATDKLDTVHYAAR